MSVVADLLDGLIGRGSVMQLRLVDPAGPYVRALGQIANAGDNPVRFGGVRDIGSFRTRLAAHDVLADFLIERRRTGRPVGLVTAYKHVPAERDAHLGVCFHPDWQGRVWAWEGVALALESLLVDRVVDCLYVDVTPENEKQYLTHGHDFLEYVGKTKVPWDSTQPPVKLYVITLQGWLDSALRRRWGRRVQKALGLSEEGS